MLIIRNLENSETCKCYSIFKKGDKFLKENYRPISILPAISKIFENVICNQLADYFSSILHPQLCGFRSKHNHNTLCFVWLANGINVWIDL